MGTGPQEGVDGGGDPPPAFTNGVSTLAGFSASGKEDGPRDVAHFNNPVNVAVGPDGLVYVADFDNSEIRAVHADGTVQTVIAQKNFVRPFGLAFAKDGTLYVSTDNDDTGAHTLMSGTIWKVNVSARTATVVIHGVGRPRGIFVMADGRLAMSDDLHHVVRALDLGNGQITTLAGAWDVKGFVDGAGASARFSTPYGVVQRPDGKLVVVDYDNARVRVVGMDGIVQTMAGTGDRSFADGAMLSAKFSLPQAIAIAPSGDIYVTDTGNHRVRKLSNNNVVTVAGSGHAGWLDSDDELAAVFFGMEGLAVSNDGALIYVADGNRGDAGPYHRVRQIKVK